MIFAKVLRFAQIFFGTSKRKKRWLWQRRVYFREVNGRRKEREQNWSLRWLVLLGLSAVRIRKSCLRLAWLINHFNKLSIWFEKVATVIQGKQFEYCHIVSTRLYTVPCFPLGSSRSSALHYGLPSCMSVNSLTKPYVFWNWF